MPETTRFKSQIQVGTASLITMGLTVMAYFAGSITTQRGINVDTTTNAGTQTGFTIQVNNVTQKQYVPVTCKFATGGTTSTGGLATYDYCIARSPLSTTGTLMALGLECGGVPRSFGMSGSFVKSLKTSATATNIKNFSTKTVVTGSIVLYSTGATKWNPADILKLQAISATWNAANDCQMFYDLRDTYGS